ncbi:hypothetical protein [Pasteuria penetrans]|nr:hypothetical protein [Pasteuria penetrans]
MAYDVGKFVVSVANYDTLDWACSPLWNSFRTKNQMVDTLIG